MLEEYFEIFMRILLNPQIAVRYLWRKIPIGSIELREKFDAFYKPSYAWGIIRAAKLARNLGLKSMSVVEFGVATGVGLIEMEKIALKCEKKYGVKIEVYGFDSSVGLPPLADYRDMNYVWKQGDFPMDASPDELRKKLTGAKLIVGNVRDTIKNFRKEYTPAPLGFVSFDFDIYSSTRDALTIFDTDDTNVLPRVWCYFDDAMGDESYCNQFTGELLAIEEFNEAHKDQKVAKINGFAAHRYIRSSWNDGVYMLHRFHHKDYNRFFGYPRRSSLKFGRRPK